MTIITQIGNTRNGISSLCQSCNGCRVRAGSGKLWKVIMPFSRNWEVVEKGEDFSRWL